MEVIGISIIEDFAQTYNQSRVALNSWLKTARTNKWRDLLDIRKIYKSADGGVKGKYTIFNIAGNKYRLITIIDYKSEIVMVKNVMTHAQYDKWNKR